MERILRVNIPSPIMYHNVAICKAEMVDAGYLSPHLELKRGGGCIKRFVTRAVTEPVQRIDLVIGSYYFGNNLVHIKRIRKA